ncbi:MAG: hypothetical protein ACR2J8_00480, partial [Thermomicrobiales bacterium]
ATGRTGPAGATGATGATGPTGAGSLRRLTFTGPLGSGDGNSTTVTGTCDPSYVLGVGHTAGGSYAAFQSVNYTEIGDTTEVAVTYRRVKPGDSASDITVQLICLAECNCSGSLPVCVNGACVQCTTDSHCGGSTPACMTATNTCVPCTQDSHCGGSTPYCNKPTNICVGQWTKETTFGTNGNGASNLSSPYFITMSADGLTMWVADTGNHRISVWTRPSTSSTAWANQTTFGSQGSGASNFYFPFSVAVSADLLTAWVADASNYRISVWGRPSAGSTTWTNKTTFSGVGFATGVAVSPDGLTLWVAENSYHRISVWTRPNTGSNSWTSQTTFGTQGSGASNFDSPYGVFVSPDGMTAWVADSNNNRMSVWTRPSTVSTSWTNQTTFGTVGSGPDNFQNPNGAFVSADGLKIWVGDWNNNRTSIWTRPSAGSTAWTNQTTFGPISKPASVAVSANSMTAWVTESTSGRIGIWTPGT